MEDKTFTKVSAEDIAGRKCSFEHCRFVNCDFSYADFGGIVFMDCRFDGCNLSLIKLSDTGLQHIMLLTG